MALTFAILDLAMAHGNSRASTKRISLRLFVNVTDIHDPVGKVTRATTYYSQISLGDPSRLFTVLVDTGSSHLWVFGRDCYQSPCLLHQRYGPASSRTSALPLGRLPAKISTTFGTGELVGRPVRDRVCINEVVVGRFSVSSRFCSDLDLLMAERETPSIFDSLPFDGILGLAPVPIEEDEASSFSSQLLKSGLSVFRVIMHDTNAVDAGEVVFSSEVDASGVLAWATPLGNFREDEHWLVSLLSISVGHEEVFLCDAQARAASESELCPALVDTGSSWMMGPEQHADRVLDAIDPGADCSKSQQLLDMKVLIAGVDGPLELTLGPEDYVERFDDECGAAFSPLSLPEGVPDVWILGQPLLRRYATTYDLRTSSVGFERTVGGSRPAMMIPSRAGFTVVAERHSPLRSDSLLPGLEPIL